MGRLLAVAHRTLKAVFAHALIVPGGKVYFLGSDGELTANIASRMEKAGVAARTVRGSYLASILGPTGWRRSIGRWPQTRRGTKISAPCSITTTCGTG